MATIKDVAKEAGVSIATVSRVVNNSPSAAKKSIASVKAAMEKLGYRPNANARALVSKNTNTIGVLVGDVSDPFFGALLKSVDKVARENNKHLLIGNGYHDAEQELQAIELLLNNCYESLILHSKALSDDVLIKYASAVPGLVLLNRFIPDIADRCITFNNQQGAYLATKHLISHGHTAIGYINSDVRIEDAADRQAGYLQALAEAGIPDTEVTIIASQPNDQGGKSAMHELLQTHPNLTAVLAYNDYMAAGALAELQKQAIAVPEKMSLIGFDNALIAGYLHAQLTSVHYPIDVMARQAAELSLQLISQTKNETTNALTLQKSVCFEPELIVRHSVGQAPSEDQGHAHQD